MKMGAAVADSTKPIAQVSDQIRPRIAPAHIAHTPSKNARLSVREPRLPLVRPGTKPLIRSHRSSRSASQSITDLQKSVWNLICSSLGIPDC